MLAASRATIPQDFDAVNKTPESTNSGVTVSEAALTGGLRYGPPPFSQLLNNFATVGGVSRSEHLFWNQSLPQALRLIACLLT